MRTALENLPESVSKQFFYLGFFPRGWCGCASELLGAYFADHEFPNFECIEAYLKIPDGTEISSHAWLEGYGLIVDITGDQFLDRLPETPQRIYVSTNREWHDKYFAIKSRNEADFRKIRPANLGDLTFLYKHLIACM